MSSRLSLIASARLAKQYDGKYVSYTDYVNSIVVAGHLAFKFMLGWRASIVVMHKQALPDYTSMRVSDGEEYLIGNMDSFLSCLHRMKFHADEQAYRSNDSSWRKQIASTIQKDLGNHISYWLTAPNVTTTRTLPATMTVGELKAKLYDMPQDAHIGTIRFC